MNKVIVIAMSADRRSFAVENEAGVCAVFALQAGCAVLPGDVLCGALALPGAQVLDCAGREVAVTGQSGPLMRGQALAQLAGCSAD